MATGEFDEGRRLHALAVQWVSDRLVCRGFSVAPKRGTPRAPGDLLVGGVVRVAVRASHPVPIRVRSRTNTVYTYRAFRWSLHSHNHSAVDPPDVWVLVELNNLNPLGLHALVLPRSRFPSLGRTVVVVCDAVHPRSQVQDYRDRWYAVPW